jgi:hypothetical protein
MVSPTPDVLEAWREGTRSFEELEIHVGVEHTLLGSGEPVVLKGARTTAGMAAMLRVEPLLGRMFTAEEAAGDKRVVVLSEELWRTRFGADRTIVGRTIDLGATCWRRAHHARRSRPRRARDWPGHAVGDVADRRVAAHSYGRAAAAARTGLRA